MHLKGGEKMLMRAPILCDCRRTYCDAYDTKDCLSYVGAFVTVVYDCKSGTECSRSKTKCGCSLR